MADKKKTEESKTGPTPAPKVIGVTKADWKTARSIVAQTSVVSIAEFLIDVMPRVALTVGAELNRKPSPSDINRHPIARLCAEGMSYAVTGSGCRDNASLSPAVTVADHALKS